MVFDPYGEWLAIPPDRRPPSHYDLLGLTPGQPSSEQIHRAAEGRYQRVQAYTLGPERDRATQLLGEIAEAVDCLTDPAKRERYDREQVGLPSEEMAAVAPTMFPAESAESPPQGPDRMIASEQHDPTHRTEPDKAAVPPRRLAAVRGQILRAARRADDALLAVAGEGNKILHGFLRAAAVATAISVLAALTRIIPPAFRGYGKTEPSAPPAVVAPAEDSKARHEVEPPPKVERSESPTPPAESPPARAKPELPSRRSRAAPPSEKPTPKKRAKKGRRAAAEEPAGKGPGLLADNLQHTSHTMTLCGNVSREVYYWGD